MEGVSRIVKINSLTADFNAKVDALIKGGAGNQQIIEKLNWNKSMFSLVRSGQRNVPVAKYELLTQVFKLDNSAHEGFAVPEAFYRERISELKERVEELKTWNQQLREHNQMLQLRVAASLETIQNNQLTQQASSEAHLQMALKLLAAHTGANPEDIERAVDSNFAQARLELAKTGSR